MRSCCSQLTCSRFLRGQRVLGTQPTLLPPPSKPGRPHIEVNNFSRPAGRWVARGHKKYATRCGHSTNGTRRSERTDRCVGACVAPSGLCHGMEPLTRGLRPGYCCVALSALRVVKLPAKSRRYGVALDGTGKAGRDACCKRQGRRDACDTGQNRQDTAIRENAGGTPAVRDEAGGSGHLDQFPCTV